ncbi:MAG: hypothetical protein MI739_09225 [Bacteroidales bacterium]|nr:hypothetical protein [Bacteroidales bacterium]
MSYKIYYNTRCRKSREGLQYLQKQEIYPEIIEYLKDSPFTKENLMEIINKLGIKPSELIRTQEQIYKQNYKGKNFSDDEWITILVENPKLIRRPIIIKDENKAVIGDIIENIDPLL